MNINNVFFTECTNQQYENAETLLSHGVHLEDEALIKKLIKHIVKNNDSMGLRWLGKHAGKKIAWIHWLHTNYYRLAGIDPAFREHWPLFHIHATVALAANTLFSTREYLTIANREFIIAGHRIDSMLTEFSLFLKQEQAIQAAANIKNILNILEHCINRTIPLTLRNKVPLMRNAIESNQIILYPAGWKEHNLYLVFFPIGDKSYLSICNRGQGAPKTDNLYQTIKTIEINKNKISKKIFYKLLNLSSAPYEEGKYFIYNELPKLLGEEPQPLEDITILQLNALCPPLQKNENCTYASLMCSMRPLLFCMLSFFNKKNAIRETEIIAKYLSNSFSCASGERYYKLFVNGVNEYLSEGPPTLDISNHLQKKKDRLIKLTNNVQQINF